MKVLSRISLVIAISLVLVMLAGACAQAPAPAPSPSPSPAPTPTAAPHPEVSVEFLAGQFGFDTYNMALASATVAKNNHPWLRIRTAESLGYVYNLERLETSPSMWGDTVIQNGDWAIRLARTKTPPFTTQVLGMRKLLTTTVFGHFLVSFQPGMETLKDAVGKKLGLGTPSQSDYYAVPRLLMEKGWGLLDQLDVEWIGSTKAAQSMQDGLVDAIQININMNPDTGKWAHQPMNIQLIGTGKKLYYIDYATPEVLDTLAKNAGFRIIPYKVPAGTLEGQDRDLNVLTSPSVLAVKDVFPEDVAYEIVKLYLDHYQEMGQYTKTAEIYSPGLFAFGLTKQDTHPGAVRAFEEAGITIPD